MGEDPYLVSVLGAAYVQGLQSAGVIATLKHFAGYSAARAGRNHGPVSMGRRELMDVILPPFETAVAQAGAGSVMNSYSDVDGVRGCGPLAAHRPAAGGVGVRRQRRLRLLGGAVPGDHAPRRRGLRRRRRPGARRRHRRRAAGHHRLRPRPGRTGTEGELPEALVDRAARRLLTQKARLGLLDAGWTPEGSVASAGAVDLDSPANRALARRWPSVRSSCSRPGWHCRCSAPVAWRHAGWPSGPAPRPACLHGLLRLSQPRAAAHSLGLGLRCRLQSTPCRRNCLDRDRPCPGLPVQEDADPAGGGLAATRVRPLRGRRRRPRRPSAPTGRPAKVATRRTSGSRECRRTCWTSSSRPGRRWWWWWSPAAPTPSATCMAAPPAWSRRSCRGGGEGRSSPASVRPGPAERETARADSQASRQAADSPAAPRQLRECRDQHPGRDPPLPLRLRQLLHELRGGCSTDQRRRVTDGAFTVSVRVRNTGPREDEVVQLYLRELVLEVAAR